ncbi:MAG: hypothetical protein OXF68_01950 [Gammaproteobacteria bacterium]|nr:hypothetical protein [Gammaproteobacteria bacterium]
MQLDVSIPGLDRQSIGVVRSADAGGETALVASPATEEGPPAVAKPLMPPQQTFHREGVPA